MSQIKVPKRFFQDHYERDLPTPAVIRETAKHYIVDSSDDALLDLVDDAKFYADENGPDVEAGLKSSARALVRIVSPYLDREAKLLNAARRAVMLLKPYAENFRNGEVGSGTYEAASKAYDILGDALGK